jgi:hypothetical protein
MKHCAQLEHLIDFFNFKREATSVNAQHSRHHSTSKTDGNMAAQIKEFVDESNHITTCGLAKSYNLIWIMAKHSDTRSEHVMDCCKFCALSTE